MPGRPFLQVPGPTNVPERILRAMTQPVLDHRGAEFAALTRELLDGLQQVFQATTGTVVLFPGSGTAGWEASIVNTLTPGDRVLAVVNGHFSTLYAQCARALGMDVEEVTLPWGAPVSADAAQHPALLLVDVVSSLGSIEFRFDAWGVDVALCGSQKGLMLPPGAAVLCVSPRALAAGEGAGCPRYFLDWRPVIEQNRSGFFPYTPATLLLLGMREALRMLFEEGLPRVFTRHTRLAEGVRRAVRSWGLPVLCRDPQAYSPTLTAVVLPEEMDSGRVIAWAASRLNLSLGAGLGKLRGHIFRIGHLGWLNEVEVLGVLGGIELALNACGIPIPPGAGVAACGAWFLESLDVPATDARKGDGVASGPR